MLQDPMGGRKKAQRARIVLADDHPAMVKDLCALLELEFEIVATVGDGNALIAAAEGGTGCHRH